jgi:hypothetical protein
MMASEEGSLRNEVRRAYSEEHTAMCGLVVELTIVISSLATEFK